MTHELKIKETFTEAVLSGDKTFEVRENDRGYQKGDIVRFKVLDQINTVHPHHLLHEKIFVITYVLSGWGIKDGYVVFGIKALEEL